MKGRKERKKVGYIIIEDAIMSDGSDLIAN